MYPDIFTTFTGILSGPVVVLVFYFLFIYLFISQTQTYTTINIKKKIQVTSLNKKYVCRWPVENQNMFCRQAPLNIDTSCP